jgi:hypothetical protein
MAGAGGVAAGEHAVTIAVSALLMRALMRARAWRADERES